MAQNVTWATINAILDSGVDSLFNSAILELRTGPQPADAPQAATGTLLWSEVLPADAFAGAVQGVKSKLGTWQGLGLAAGNANWFRLKLASDTNAVTNFEARLDGLVTALGGGGEIELNNVTIALNQSVEILTCSVTILTPTP